MAQRLMLTHGASIHLRPNSAVSVSPIGAAGTLFHIVDYDSVPTPSRATTPRAPFIPAAPRRRAQRPALKLRCPGPAASTPPPVICSAVGCIRAVGTLRQLRPPILTALTQDR